MHTLDKIEAALEKRGWRVEDASAQYASKNTKGLPTFSESWFHPKVWAGQIGITSSYTSEPDEDYVRDMRYVEIEAYAINMQGVDLEGWVIPTSVEAVMRAADAMVQFYSVFPEQV